MAVAAKHAVEVETGHVTGPGGLEFFWREWQAKPSDAGASVLFVHGLGEHSGRYDDLGRFFASRGVSLLGFDLRGHGLSGGPRGHVDRFADFIDDVMFFREFIGRRHPKDRIVLLGHSMGGLIALATAEAHGDVFACVVASAPLLGVEAKVPGWKVTLGKVMSGLAPRLAMTNEIDPSALSRNQEVGRRYVADPNVGNKVTARWFVETVIRGMAATNAGAGRIAIPVFILQGTADRLVSPPASRAFYDRLGNVPKAFRSFDGFYHELFQEDDKQDVFRIIWDWLGDVGVVHGA